MAMKMRMETIFRVAAPGVDRTMINGNDSLLLGAFGCGAFSNPPKVVAQIFRELIGKYSHFFTEIGFAVLDCGTGNYNIFRNILFPQ